EAPTRGGETWQRTMMGCTTRGGVKTPPQLPLHSDFLLFAFEPKPPQITPPLASAGDPPPRRMHRTVVTPLPAFGRGTPQSAN
ncbi:MAG: hypothetical protein CMB52_00900, partial [Euryarchaeota archaeon]|nr:hypothetical protein [Euryarchaeota archaeon]